MIGYDPKKNFDLIIRRYLNNEIEKMRDIINRMYSVHSDILVDLAKRLDKLEFESKELNSRINELGYTKKPHKCPVCDGTGKSHDAILLSMPPQWPSCNTCEGKGIVWG